MAVASFPMLAVGLANLWCTVRLERRIKKTGMIKDEQKTFLNIRFKIGNDFEHVIKGLKPGDRGASAVSEKGAGTGSERGAGAGAPDVPGVTLQMCFY